MSKGDDLNEERRTSQDVGDLVRDPLTQMGLDRHFVLTVIPLWLSDDIIAHVLGNPLEQTC